VDLLDPEHATISLHRLVNIPDSDADVVQSSRDLGSW
jgi:hypothetical protein